MPPTTARASNRALSIPRGGSEPLGLRSQRFAFLLGSLLSLLLLSPVLGGRSDGTLFLTALFTLVMLAAVLAASDRATTLYVALAMAVPWLYLTWLHPLWRGDAAGLMGDLLMAGLTFFVLGLVLLRVLRAERVGADTLCGAIAAYLLIAIAWSVCYSIIETLAPGSFRFTDEDPSMIWNELLYFSLVTLTTLGYGDVTPLSAIARIWSALEALIGTLFLAVLISRLVGIYRR